MKSIFKYKLEATELQKITMPYTSLILSVQEQDGGICIWAQVDLDSSLTEEKTIQVLGTGQHFLAHEGVDRIFLGTCQIDNLVFHIFELK